VERSSYDITSGCVRLYVHANTTPRCSSSSVLEISVYCSSLHVYITQHGHQQLLEYLRLTPVASSSKF
jgi:hypothetical protein